MWFRNLQLYRLPAPWDITIDRLADQLGRLSFQPCGSQDPMSRGFTAPVQDGGLVHSVGGQWMIALTVEQRLLPSSVVNETAEERAEEIEAQQGYKPGRKQIKEIKDAVMQELLPRAFTRRRRTYVWIDPKGGWLAIDASSRKGADVVIEALGKALDELPIKLLNTRLSPAGAMTQWLAEGDAPGAFTIDQDCELASVTDEKSAVRYVRHTLEGGEIREHIASGKQVTRLAMTFDDRVSLVLNDKFEIKRLQVLDVVKEAAGAPDAISRDEQFDADFALMTGELQRVIPALIDALGGEEKTI
ncbi:recombination-associated protein RdgC [Uliginosibacterium sp. sgz301328]|uniref:recombination-associated protein RdgC n=1 Tax=Uliginosibacterium sp. sgz301328 TaxID=3243764 RepID=UPI00359D26A8